MTKQTDAQLLHDLVAQTIEAHGAAPRVEPAIIAQEVMDQLDSEKASHPVVWIGCNLEVRQIARGLLGKHFDPARPPSDPDQLELFEGLQARYPEAPKPGVARPDGPAYVLRDLMTDEDVAWNVSRLRAESRAKLAHADALEAWNISRRTAA